MKPHPRKATWTGDGTAPLCATARVQAARAGDATAHTVHPRLRPYRGTLRNPARRTRELVPCSGCARAGTHVNHGNVPRCSRVDRDADGRQGGNPFSPPTLMLLASVMNASMTEAQETGSLQEHVAAARTVRTIDGIADVFPSPDTVDDPPNRAGRTAIPIEGGDPFLPADPCDQTLGEGDPRRLAARSTAVRPADASRTPAWRPIRESTAGQLIGLALARFETWARTWTRLESRASSTAARLTRPGCDDYVDDRQMYAGGDLPARPRIPSTTRSVRTPCGSCDTLDESEGAAR